MNAVGTEADDGSEDTILVLSVIWDSKIPNNGFAKVELEVNPLFELQETTDVNVAAVQDVEVDSTESTFDLFV